MRIALRLVLLLVVLPFFSGCESGTGIEDTATPTATLSTLTQAAPSPTFSPTPTPDPAQVQRDALYLASLNYLASDEDLAFEVAHSLGYSQSYGRPHDMCGPLAFKILQDAGIVSKYITLRDYWLLYPPDDAYLLERAFPRSSFTWLKIDQPIDQVDYRQFPLLAGDLLFIYSGTRGDYSHVLAVTRVDDAGRAYSVTNNYTEDGFVIQEYMLYDTADPGKGIFYEWSDPENARLGLTGFGGFDLWRPNSLPYYADPGDPQLIEAVDDVLSESGGEWYVRIENMDDEVLYSRRANYHITDPLAIRLPVAFLFLKSLESRGISSLRDYLEDNPADGQTFYSLLQASLNDGDLEAADVFRKLVSQSGLDIPASLRNLGLKDTNLSANTVTAEDLITLLRILFTNGSQKPDSSEIILELMSAETGQDLLRAHALEGFTVYNLPVNVDSLYPAVSHLAILEGKDIAYLVAIFAYQSNTSPVTSHGLEQTVDNLSQELWSYISENSPP